MNRDRWIQLVCLLLAGILLVVSAALQTQLDSRRVELNLLAEASQAPQVRPELRLIQAMPGWARSTLLQAAWIRSQGNKQKSKSFDAEQLAWTICNLQWRYPGVWSHLSWDLAFNWSVKKHTPFERWKWVSAGIELLQSGGIPSNPDAIELYHQLSWTYFFKVGGIADGMHLQYKGYLAGQYHRILGAPPRSGDTEETAQWIARVAGAAADEQSLRSDPAVDAFVRQIEGANVKLNIGLLDAYNRWSNDPLVKMVGQPPAEASDENSRKLAALMTEPSLASAREKVVAHVRRAVLVKDRHMDPDWMLALTRKYGPLDWRLPWSHSLYWGTYGVHHVRGFSMEDITSLNTERNVVNSLKDLTTSGRLMLMYNANDPSLPVPRMDLNWRFVQACHREHLLQNEAMGDADEVRLKLMDGHINYLTDAIVAFYFAGRPDDAKAYLSFIKREYRPDDPKWNLGLDDFVMYIINEEQTTRQRMAQQVIQVLLERSCFALLEADEQAYQTSVQLAQQIWDNYDRSASAERLRLVAMRDQHALVAGWLINGWMVGGQPALASQLYRSLPIDVQQVCYILTIEPNQPSAEALPGEAVAGLNSAFPAPPGLDQARQAIQQRFRQYEGDRRPRPE